MATDVADIPLLAVMKHWKIKANQRRYAVISATAALAGISKMKKSDLARIINSDEVKFVVKSIQKEVKWAPKKKNPLKNLNTMVVNMLLSNILLLADISFGLVLKLHGMKAHPVYGTGEKAKDPIFGLAMGGSSQASADVFRWFCVESGNAAKPSVILIHGFISFTEYVSALESVINELGVNKVSLVVQGYFAPIVVKHASNHQEKLNDLILLNPPHANLPSTLSIFSNFLLGEIFSQVYNILTRVNYMASDKTLTSCGPYKMKEDDAMVYRRPYLTSGSSGFALNAITRAMKKELKIYVEEMRKILLDDVFCNAAKHQLVELPMAGHHVQEDSGEELGSIIAGLISRKVLI
ncbi:hypothetical protein E3N88_35673 [Mikania micrantha]|uniref:Large ribosomal subunit protein uL4 C-terminal domain-containing protein n=1 Tax=Mikania micrantha TaxID=192012 RepID=A0A5N6M4D8_9ASTR|nr:hypothetical protein E3N88_35673 [Mikania micrantha]